MAFGCEIIAIPPITKAQRDRMRGTNERMICYYQPFLAELHRQIIDEHLLHARMLLSHGRTDTHTHKHARCNETKRYFLMNDGWILFDTRR